MDYSKVFYTKKYDRLQQGFKTKNKDLIFNSFKALEKESISFALVIQDEASKATPPELALPMVYAKKSIIIGDHRQLPPMVDANEFIENLDLVSRKIQNEGDKKKAKDLIHLIQSNRKEFEVSHFERIFSSIPSSLKAAFSIQYRMHPSINDAIGQFYPLNKGKGEHGLTCGLAPEFIDSKDFSNPQSRYHGISIPDFLTPDDHILWINTDSPELKHNTSRYNMGEVEVIERIISAFSTNDSFNHYLSQWKEEEDQQIGIISFYGAQLSKLKEMERRYPSLPMRISTVDKFQGMERNILIVSTVRSNKLAFYENQDLSTCEPQESLGFAEFPNRLNVALSRAKRLLIIVGNKGHFSQKEIYQNVLEAIEKSPNGKIIDAKQLLQTI